MGGYHGIRGLPAPWIRFFVEHPAFAVCATNTADVQSDDGCLNSGAYHGSFCLPASRMGLPIRPDHAIDAELGIIREAAKVSSVGPVLHLFAPRDLCCVEEALIHPVPNEPPLQVGMPVKGFPVLLKQSQQSAQDMSGSERRQTLTKKPQVLCR